MAKKRNYKFCPRCGARNDLEDAYCIKCGHSFVKRSKKMNIKNIILIIIIILGFWAVIRLILKQPIIPQELIDIVKNITNNQTG